MVDIRRDGAADSGDPGVRIPHTLILLWAMIVVAWLLTWLLPAGRFETVANEAGVVVVVPETWRALDAAPRLSPLALFTVIPRALADAQAVIFFVLIVGGVLGVIRATGALDAAMGRLLERFGDRVGTLLLGGTVLFGVASSTFGMAVEYIALIPILLTLFRGLRLDAVAALGVVAVGYAVGYGAAALNPFTVLVAQNVAGLQPGSGLWLRLLAFVVLLAIGFHHVWRYAQRLLANPAASLVHDVPAAQAPPAAADQPPLSARHVRVLWAMLATLIALVTGIVVLDWYLVELTALFLGLAVAAWWLGGLDADDTARAFGEGAAAMTMTALLVGFARAIALTLEDGQVLHTIVHGLSMPLGLAGPELAAVGMLAVQSILNLFVPSGSGQALVTMPLMAPIGDIVGVSRQVAVLAFLFGDGLMNIVVPTNAVLMGMLGVAGVPYDRWLRFVGPLVLKLLGAAAIVLMAAVWIGYT
jgi:uncharacterized ion transporter superfamily protein YfcC